MCFRGVYHNPFRGQGNDQNQGGTHTYPKICPKYNAILEDIGINDNTGFSWITMLWLNSGNQIFVRATSLDDIVVPAMEICKLYLIVLSDSCVGQCIFELEFWKNPSQ